LAYQVENDPKILVEEDFNAVKTWVEYINRLIGAVIGLLIFGTFVLSIRFWKKDRPITVLSFVAFVLVGFQGWIGSIVVSTNLLQWMITIHMLLAIAIVGLLIYVYFRSKRDSLKQLNDTPSKLKWIVIACLLLTIVQIVLGTQVREGVDMVAEFAARSEWISNLGLTFIIHRSYSLLLLALHGYLFYILLNSESLKSITKWLLVIVVMEILSGAIMAYFGVPAFIQPIHLLLGTLIVGVQYYLLLLINHKQRNIA